MAKPISYLGPYNWDRITPYMSKGMAGRGAVDELLSQRTAETLDRMNVPPGTRVIESAKRSPQDQARAIASVAARNRIPFHAGLLRSGIPGMAAPVGGSRHQHGEAVDISSPYVQAFAVNMAPDLRQPLPRSDAGHFELAKGAEGAGAPQTMAASGNDTMAAIPGATQPTQPYSGMMPEDVNYSRRMGEMLMRQGMSTAPVGHWTQALARVLQGASGGGWMADAQRGGREGQMAGNQALAAALANPSVTPAQYAQTALANPYTAPQGQQMAQAVMAQRAKPQDPLLNERRNLMQAQADRLRMQAIAPPKPMPETTADKEIAKSRVKMAEDHIKGAQGARDASPVIGELEKIANDPALEAAIGPLQGFGIAQTLGSKLPFSQTLGIANPELNARIERLQSQLELAGGEKMRGLGAQSDADAKRLQRAISNLTGSRNKKEFSDAIRIIKQSMQSALARGDAARKAFPQLDLGGGVAAPPAAPANNDPLGIR